jgi:hypothetical protein
MASSFRCLTKHHSSSHSSPRFVLVSSPSQTRNSLASFQTCALLCQNGAGGCPGWNVFYLLPVIGTSTSRRLVSKNILSLTYPGMVPTLIANGRVCECRPKWNGKRRRAGLMHAFSHGAIKGILNTSAGGGRTTPAAPPSRYTHFRRGIQASLRDAGELYLHPAINRRATLSRPSGTDWKPRRVHAKTVQGAEFSHSRRRSLRKKRPLPAPANHYSIS